MTDHRDEFEDRIQPDDDEEDELFEEEIDYAGALCSRCWAALDEEGYCTTSSCPYSDYLQDESGGWLDETDGEEQP
jgi:hypothetical protein